MTVTVLCSAPSTLPGSLGSLEAAGCPGRDSTERCIVARSSTSVLGLFADIVKPIADAWEAEGGPKWFAGLRMRVGGWLQRLGGRISGVADGVAVKVSLSVEFTPVSPVASGAEIPHPVAPETVAEVQPEPTSVPSAAGAEIPHPVEKPKRVRKPVAKKPVAPKAKVVKEVKKPAAKPMKAAAQVKAKPKAAPRKRVKAEG